jgi:hypothetical protein
MDVRSVTRVVDVAGVDAQAAYSRALAWFETNHGRATIRLGSHDPEAGAIVGGGEMQCHSSVGAGLRAMGLGRNQNYLRFNMDFQAKDGRFRVVFGELYYYIHDVQFETSHLQQGPSNQREVELLYRDCLKDVEASLVGAVTGRSVSHEF